MEILSEAEVFLVKKRVILVIFQISESKERQKTDKIRSMTKKSHQKYWALKWKFFPNKRLFKNLGPRNLFRPPKLGAKSPSMMKPMTYMYQLSAVGSDNDFVVCREICPGW